MTVYESDGGVASTNTYYAIKDHQNSVIALVDDSGTVVETYEYDAYGNTKVFDATGSQLTESAYGNRYLFQGREIDWTTGLYYFRARWYNPDTGRWLSRDPLGISGGLNLYTFCRNNPVNFVDPLGLVDYWVGPVYRGDDATIVADGKGGIRPYIPEGFGEPGSLDYCITLFHEQVHIIDAYMGLIEQGADSLKMLQKAIDGQSIVILNDEETIRTEINAWSQTLKFIRKMLNDPNHPYRKGASDSELKAWEKRALKQLNSYKKRQQGCQE